jgi:hypothetical protein
MEFSRTRSQRIIDRCLIHSKEDRSVSLGFISELTDPEVPKALEQAAQVVIEHLCVLRGGGLILSAMDGRLLVDWLDAGISPALIGTALERVAEKRRKRRVKAPLSLRSCRAEVKRLSKRQPAHHFSEAELAAPFKPMDRSIEAEPLATLVQRAVADLGRLAGGDLEERAERAMRVVRAFHRDAWEASTHEHDVLLAVAAEELDGLRESMDAVRWAAALESVARDILRKRYPMLSAASVWDRLHL